MQKKNKMIHKFNADYNIGDRVYHVTPDSPLGIVLDIDYSVVNNSVKYLVTFGHTSADEVWCTTLELSPNKAFN